jgi:hypothetical protein
VPHKSTVVHFLTHFHEKVSVSDHKFSDRPTALNDVTGKTSDILLCNLQKILNKSRLFFFILKFFKIRVTQLFAHPVQLTTTYIIQLF